MKNLIAAAATALFIAFSGAASAADESTWNPNTPYATDIVIGATNAPVTVVEYASLTCPHCGRFHNESWPEFKKNWVDTGKAKFVFRHLPLDQSALAGALTVSCVPKDKQGEFISEMFASVSEWAPSQEMAPVIQKVYGDSVKFEDVLSCISVKGFPEQVMQPATDAVNNGVEATPTFFVNGVKLEGFRTAADLGKLVDDKLAEEVLQ